MTPEQPEWRKYLGEFHGSKAGITERVLNRSYEDGQSPYQWLAASTGNVEVLLDLASGSAPVAYNAKSVIGIDRALAELTIAADKGMPVVQGDATALPFPDAMFDTVACAMGIMLLQPLDTALREAARVLKPDGTFVAIIPASSPLTTTDRVNYGRLLLALRQLKLQYPNDDDLKDANAVFRGAGFSLESDESRRFAYRPASTDDTDELVESFYLPGVEEKRVDAAKKAAQSLVGSEIGIPIRRFVCRRAT